MRLVMNPGHEYVVFGRRVRAGDEFEIPDTEARLWKLLGRARDAPPKAKSMNAEPAPTPEQEPIKRGPGRPRKYPIEEPARYDRRDMRAKDDD
jgi:hypothetical protein